MYKLIIKDDDGRATAVPFARDEITIGRKEGNTIRLTERNVSRNHARLMRSNGNVTVEDLDSYNGVRVNGHRITGRATLREGDLVEIGDYVIALESDTADIGGRSALGPGPGPGKDEVPTTRRLPANLVGATTVRDRPAAAAEDQATTNAPDAETTRPPGAAQTAAPTALGVARLVGVSEPVDGVVFPLEKQEVTVGRVEGNDIVVNHQSVSRNHARFFSNGVWWKVVDLGSAKGIAVNGEEFAMVEIKPGDTISVGQVKFRFERESTAEEKSNQCSEKGAASATTGASEEAPSAATEKPARDEKAVSVMAPPASVPRSTKVVIWVALAVAAIALVALIVGLSGTKTDQPAAPRVGAVPTRPAEEGRAVPRVARVEAPAREATPVPPEQDERARKFAIARQDMEAERWDDAMRIFHQWMQAHPEDGEARALFVETRREADASRAFERLNTAYGRESWGEFVLLAQKIPDQSRYRQKMMLFISKLYERAETLVAAGQTDRAITLIQQILRADPKNEATKRLLVELSRRIEIRRPPARVEGPGATATTRGAAAAAGAALAATAPSGRAEAVARGSSPGDGKGHRELTKEDQAKIERYERAGTEALWSDPGHAVNLLTDVLRVDPTRVITHRLLGVAYANLDKKELAIHFYKRYLAMNPSAKDRPSVERTIEKLEKPQSMP